MPGTLVRVDTVVDNVITIDASTATDTTNLTDFDAATAKVRHWESDGAAGVVIPTTNNGWIPLEEGVEIKEFSGGLYAVTRCKGVKNITPTWHRLGTWCENSKYKISSHQWLEEHFVPATEPIEEAELVVDLHCPIEE